MKKIIFILLFSHFTPPSLKLRRASISPLYAEVNLLEPLRAGVESKIPEKQMQ